MSSHSPDAAAPPAEPPQAPDLVLRIVTERDRPDHCTLHPPCPAGDAALTTWLSADRDALVDCVANR